MTRYGRRTHRGEPDSLAAWGATAVEEILRLSPGLVTQILVERSGGRLDSILDLARQAGIAVVSAERSQIAAIAGERARLIAAVLRPFPYTPLEDLIAGCGEKALVVAADSITDPGNLGAVARSLKFFGGQGLILPMDNSTPVTEVVVRRSAAAVLHLPVSRVTNLSRSLEELKKNGFWVYGSVARGGMPLDDVEFPARTCLVLGAEGKGMRPGVQKHCDELLTLSGQFESLNVSSFAAVLFYHWNKTVYSVS